MDGSDELESSLLTQPWASVCFGESTFLAKVCFKDSGYVLLISDLSSVWYESADTEAVGQRSKVSVWEVQGPPFPHAVEGRGQLGDTTAVGFDRTWVQTPSARSLWLAMPKCCHPGYPGPFSWPSYSSGLGQPGVHRGCVLRPAHLCHSWPEWAGGFSQTSTLRRGLKQGCLPTSGRDCCPRSQSDTASHFWAAQCPNLTGPCPFS